MTDERPVIRLRSPDSICRGGILVVPPDSPPGFVAELIKRGYTRLDDPSTPTRKEKRAHG